MGKATIFISGTVSQMPRFREITTKDGKRTKMTFNVPADHGFGEHKSTTFYECDHWMPTSERGVNYLTHAMGKGAKVAVIGTHRTRDWKGSDDEVHHVECVDVKELDILCAAPAVDVKEEPQGGQSAPQNGSQDVYDADIPF
jgi:single-stranded DNA-binding protein